MHFFLSLMLLLIGFTQASAEDKHDWTRPATIPQPKNNPITKDSLIMTQYHVLHVIIQREDGVDLKPVKVAVGVDKRHGSKNSPTILNTALGKKQFWDGRSKSLEAQALGPMSAEVEMNMPLDKLIPKLNAVKGYVKKFHEIYPNEPITQEHLAQVIASFERTIIAPDAPFDTYIKGSANAISAKAIKGFELFKGKAHCIDCHDSFNFSDGGFYNIGLAQGELPKEELGRYNVKKRATWYGVMKTPTLRDLTKSYPYFHDGSAATIEESTEICAKGGRYDKNVRNKSDTMKDRNLTKEEVQTLVVFLKTLTSPDLNISIPTKFPN